MFLFNLEFSHLELKNKNYELVYYCSTGKLIIEVCLIISCIFIVNENSREYKAIKNRLNILYGMILYFIQFILFNIWSKEI